MNFANAELGDVAASSSITLNISSLRLLSRSAGPFKNSGVLDSGLSFVAPHIVFNGFASYAALSNSPRAAYWNTTTGEVAGTNNLNTLKSSFLVAQPQMLRQFNALSPNGMLLQPLAIPPPEPLPSAPYATIPPQISASPWIGTPGYVEGIWVKRSLDINGRWNSQAERLENADSPLVNFLEL